MYTWDSLVYTNSHICKYLHGIHMGLGNLLKASQMIIQVSPKVEYVLALLSIIYHYHYGTTTTSNERMSVTTSSLRKTTGQKWYTKITAWVMSL